MLKLPIMTSKCDKNIITSLVSLWGKMSQNEPRSTPTDWCPLPAPWPKDSASGQTVYLYACGPKTPSSENCATFTCCAQLEDAPQTVTKAEQLTSSHKGEWYHKGVFSMRGVPRGGGPRIEPIYSRQMCAAFAFSRLNRALSLRHGHKNSGTSWRS